MPTRTSAAPLTRAASVDGYHRLLRAAEANPEEVFTIAGDKLAILLREFESAARRVKRSRANPS